MTELVGDVVIPSELILPNTTTMPQVTGALICSGGILYYFDGTNPVEI